MSELERLGAICSAAVIAQTAKNNPANSAATKAAYRAWLEYRNASRRIEGYSGIIPRGDVGY